MNNNYNQMYQYNGTNQQNFNSQEKNKKNFIIVAVIIVAIVVIVGFFLLKGKNSNSASNSNVNLQSNLNSNVKTEEKETFQANIHMLTKEENGRHTPFFNNYRPTFKIAGKEAVGAITLEDGVEMVMPGDNAFVTIKLESSVPIQEGMSFEIYEGGRKIGTGIVSKEKNENLNSNTNNNVPNYQKVTIGKVNPGTNLSYDATGAFLMYIEDVFTITEKGTVVTGKISRGTIKVGDEIQILGKDGEILTTQIKSIEKFRNELDSGKIDDNVGLLLKDVERDQVERGEALVAPNTMIATTDFEADIHVLSKREGGEGKTISSKSQAYFSIGVTSYNGKISTNSAIKEGEDGTISVRLSNPIAMEVGTKFSVFENGKTIASGKVTKVK